jgi:hypothetical protein
MIKYSEIDIGLEKYVFLYNAKEGNPGIYELTWELSHYELTIEDKYKMARQILTELIKDGLVVLEKFSNSKLENKLETVSLDKIDAILNNPCYWYPSGEIYAIDLTEKGETYLTDYYTGENIDKVDKRWIK